MENSGESMEMFSVGKGDYLVQIKKNPMWEAIRWDSFVKRSQTVVLVIDPQNDCLHPNGNLSRIGWTSWKVAAESGSIANIRRIVRTADEQNVPVIWFRTTRSKGYRESLPGSFDAAWIKYMSAKVPHFLEQDTWDIDIVDELKSSMGKNDVILDKQGASAFESTPLTKIIASIGATSLIVTGYFTDFCVEGTVRTGFDKGYLNIIAGDACNARINDAHGASLQRMENDYGHVIGTDRVVELLTSL